MALDEYLFGKIMNFFSKKSVSTEVQARTVYLENLKPKLGILARALTGKAIDIFPAEREGGYKNNSFFLPESFSLFSDIQLNTKFYLFRTLYLCLQKEFNLHWDDGLEHSLTHSQQKAKETSAQVLEKMFFDFPDMKEIYSDISTQLYALPNPDDTWLFGKWMTEKPEEVKTQDYWAKETLEAIRAEQLTTLKAKAIEEQKSLIIDQKQQEDYVMTHNFEKVETAEEFNGNWRDFDGADELESHADAIQELDMRFTVRSHEPVHSIYQTDFVDSVQVAEVSDVKDSYCLTYDEWDFSKKNYRKNYCKLFPSLSTETDVPYTQRVLEKYGFLFNGLRKMFSSVQSKRQLQRRQNAGDQFDIDALTDFYTDIISQHSPSENIYLQAQKREKDLSVLLLLDLSLSSEGYANGNKVLDVEKEISLIFGELMTEFGIDFAIDGFSSQTRNHSSYINIKDFQEPWHTCKHRVGAVKASGYTRIGVALRHAGAKLQKREAKNKWLILISDGKPNDFDKYEGKYGVQDVKQALEENHHQQIYSYAFAVESQARYYLPQMFGQNHFQIIHSPIQLMTALSRLMQKIKF